MQIVDYSPDHLSLIVRNDGTEWTYERVPPLYVDRIQKYIRNGAEGKAWQMLRRFRVERRARVPQL